MKVSIKNLISLAVVAMSLSACGSGTGTYTNGAGQTCTNNGVCTGGTYNTSGGSVPVTNGVIYFSLINPTFNQSLSAMVGGVVPYIPNLANAGNYGQSIIGVSSTGITNTGTGYPIQYSQKQSLQTQGNFSIYGTSQSLSGTIQLGSVPMQALLATFGPSATITNIGVYIVQTPYNSYQYIINAVHVYIYVNGSATPVEVVF